MNYMCLCLYMVVYTHLNCYMHMLHAMSGKASVPSSREAQMLVEKIEGNRI